MISEKGGRGGGGGGQGEGRRERDGERGRCTVLSADGVLTNVMCYLAGLCVCGSSETVDSIGPPSAKSTSVSHSRHEGGGRK